MLFRNAFKGLRLRGTASRLSSRKMSTVEGAESGAGSGLAVAVVTTFGTYMMADTLSNFIQHPTQKVRDLVV
jgi:hypothetical protein